MSDQAREDTSDHAELQERDRDQPNLVTQQANRRADDDTSDREEREGLVDEVEEDR